MPDVRDIFDSFDELQAQTTPLHRPAGGMKYLFSWTENKQKDDWRADGYRWRQGGSFEQKVEDGIGVLKITYFKVRQT